jgi:phosphoserine phosphatase RsbU/P
VVVIVLALLIYQSTLAVIGAPPGIGLRVAADLAAMLAFGSAAYLVTRTVLQRPLPPVPAFWLPLVVGIIGLLATRLLESATGGPAVLHPEHGIPTSIAGAVQIVGTAVFEGAIAIILLIALQSLILFRRSTASVRNWRWMLGLTVVGSVMLIGQDPFVEPSNVIPHVVLLIGAVVLMIANSFRLAWIVYLPFKKKVTILLLAFALIAFVGLWVRMRQESDVQVAVTAALSLPFSQFVTIVMMFGVLYAVTALLALLFHLPTAGALEQKSGEMEALQALARLSSEVFDRDRLVDTIAGAPVETGVAQAAWLALIEPERGSLKPRLVAAQGLTPTQVRAMIDVEALADYVCTSSEPLLLDHAPADHRVFARPGDGIGSLLVLPLRVHDEPMGALFATRAVSQGFERADVAAMQTFASQATLALSNARLFAERIERERLARELAIAREVQQRLFPDRLPCTARLSCAALSLAAQEVAGDYYDVIELGDGHTGFIVADVSGKGTPAAFHMAELKGVFQSVSRLARGPGEFLVRANVALWESLRRSAFISAIYAVLHEASGELRLARAGHCPAALVTPNGTVRLIRPAGIGLGLDSGGVFERALEETRVMLAPGDTLLLYTDGLVEARDPAGDEFGYERLTDVLAKHHRLGPEELRDTLIAELRSFARRPANDESWEDDLTLVILRWSGAAREITTSPTVGLPEETAVPA